MDSFGALFAFKLFKQISISFNKSSMLEFEFFDKKSSPKSVKLFQWNGKEIDSWINKVHSSHFLIMLNSK